MHANHPTIASLTLLLGAGTLIVSGSICMLSAQARTVTEFFRNRGR
jgi:hypothetical protein